MFFCVIRYIIDDSATTRAGKRTVDQNKQTHSNFYKEFDQQFAAPLCNSHLQVLLSKKTQFVGTKTLNSSLRFVSMALNKIKMRKLCQQHIHTILFELTLPLLMLGEYEYTLWNENSIEYVRLQVDVSNSWNVKRTNQELIKTICSIRQTRKNKISENLANYLTFLCQSLQGE